MMYAKKCKIPQDGGWNSSRIVEDFPNLEVVFSPVYDKTRMQTGFIVNDGHCEAFVSNKIHIDMFEYIFGDEPTPLISEKQCSKRHTAAIKRLKDVVSK